MTIIRQTTLNEFEPTTYKQQYLLFQSEFQIETKAIMCWLLCHVLCSCVVWDVIKVTTDNFITDFREQEQIKSFLYGAYLRSLKDISGSNISDLASYYT